MSVSVQIPYSQVHALGNILLAARSGQLHTYSLADGKLISTWKHPDVEKVAEAVNRFAEEKEVALATGAGEDAPMADDDKDEPPAKRQKMLSEEESSVSITTDMPPADVVDGESSSKSQKAKGKDKASRSRVRVEGRAKVPDRPLITHLTSTPDKKHVIAVTGHDKALWVFEHDGQGNLKELSSRIMPKRPSSIVFGPDSMIICADKFGDVYSLPLTPDPNWKAPVVAKTVTETPIEANEFTVHSRRNRRALESQQLQAKKKPNNEQDKATDAPAFEFTLLLGHVSLLTALLVAEREGRKYIITADRDEHIRVSRYIPQAHIIEGFCLGHKDFIGDLVIPEQRSDILISGGGENELFVWDWLAGNLASTASVLNLAQQIDSTITKVAVSGLYSLVYPSDLGKLTYVLAICEGVKAIFSWLLTDDNRLNHPGVIQLPGNPLDLEILPVEGGPPKIVTAMDPGAANPANSINIFTLNMNEERLSVDDIVTVEENTVKTSDIEATEDVVRGLLYNVEYLRKKGGGGGEDGEGGDGPATEVEASGEAQS